MASEVAVDKKDWKSANGNVTSVEMADGRYGPIYTVSFNYKVGEHWHGGVFTGSDEYKVDDQVALRYNPDDPDKNDLTAKEHRKQVFMWVVIGLLAVWLLTTFFTSLPKH